MYPIYASHPDVDNRFRRKRRTGLCHFRSVIDCFDWGIINSWWENYWWTFSKILIKGIPACYFEIVQVCQNCIFLIFKKTLIFDLLNKKITFKLIWFPLEEILNFPKIPFSLKRWSLWKELQLHTFSSLTMTIFPDFFHSRESGISGKPGTAKIFPGIPGNQTTLIFEIDTVAFF